MVLETIYCLGLLMATGFGAHIPIVIDPRGDSVAYPNEIVVNQDLVIEDITDYYTIDLQDSLASANIVLGNNEDCVLFPTQIDVSYYDRSYRLESLTFACVRNDLADPVDLEFGGARGMPFYYWQAQYSTIKAYGEIWSMPFGVQWVYDSTSLNNGVEGWYYNCATYTRRNGQGSNTFGLTTQQFYNWCDSFAGLYLYSFKQAYVQGFQNGMNRAWGEALAQTKVEYYNSGFDAGYLAGYNDGVESASESGAIVSNLFGAVVSIPIAVLGGLTPLAIWNVPIISIIITLLMVAMLLWLVRKFI